MDPLTTTLIFAKVFLSSDTELLLLGHASPINYDTIENTENIYKLTKDKVKQTKEEGCIPHVSSKPKIWSFKDNLNLHVNFKSKEQTILID